MNGRWHELDVFIRVAETGNFSRTARELNLSQPSTSRIVTSLETRLGVKLLLRTTRNVALTEAGALFLEKARQATTVLEDAEDAARGVDSLRGTIRLATPVVYGARAVVPALPTFLEKYPDLRVEISMRDEMQNLVASGVDIAIRMGTLEDSTFGARQLASIKRILVASPDYIARRGMPLTHIDLAGHDTILHEQSGGTRNTLKLIRGDEVYRIDVHGRIKIDSASGVLAATLAGLGIANVTTIMSDEERRAGKLVQLLPAYELEPLNAFAVFPSGPKPSAKIRALVEHFVVALKGG